jgi:hypothetical protein
MFLSFDTQAVKSTCTEFYSRRWYARTRLLYVATWHTKKYAPGIKLRVGLGHLIIIKQGMSLFQPKPNSLPRNLARGVRSFGTVTSVDYSRVEELSAFSLFKEFGMIIVVAIKSPPGTLTASSWQMSGKRLLSVYPTFGLIWGKSSSPLHRSWVT